MKKQLAALALMLTALGSANAQLQARDIDGNGSIDAFYDVQQNISWLADANYYVTSGGALDQTWYSWSSPDPQYHAEGQVRLTTALSFVQNLMVAGLGGWRLPERLVQQGDPTGTLYYCNAVACDTQRRWPDELSVMAASIDGAGPFLNVQDGNWGYLTFSEGVNYAQVTNPFTGNIIGTDETSIVWGYVWAVHDGDVGNGTTAAVTPVPEPETYALMLAGLLAFGLRAAKKPRQDA